MKHYKKRLFLRLITVVFCFILFIWSKDIYNITLFDISEYIRKVRMVENLSYTYAVMSILTHSAFLVSFLLISLSLLANIKIFIPIAFILGYLWPIPSFDVTWKMAYEYLIYSSNERQLYIVAYMIATAISVICITNPLSPMMKITKKLCVIPLLILIFGVCCSAVNDFAVIIAHNEAVSQEFKITNAHDTFSAICTYLCLLSLAYPDKLPKQCKKKRNEDSDDMPIFDKSIKIIESDVEIDRDRLRVLGEIRQYKKFVDDGIITKEEFQQKRDFLIELYAKAHNQQSNKKSI